MESVQNSPAFLRTSLAAAMTLNLRPGIFFRGASLHCLNLLLTYPEGCSANCTYCGLSGANDGPENQSFIRVEWPVFAVDEIISRLRNRGDRFERACISMIMHPDAVEDTIHLIKRLRLDTGLPVSVLVNPSTLHDGDLEAFFHAGADKATIAIDAATQSLFEKHRGKGVRGPHNWDNYWDAMTDAALVFGRGGFGSHLIVGLGENEREMVETIQNVRALGGQTHLFSFYPEKGSALEAADPCPVSQFRRIQLARFLIDYNLVECEQMEFDEHGRLCGFGLNPVTLDEIVSKGEPFMTSGCAGKTMDCACNRPFGDGPPGDIRSFPFRLEPEDIQLVRKQLATYKDVPAPVGV